MEAYTIWTVDEASDEVKKAIRSGFDAMNLNAGGLVEAHFVCDPNNEDIIGIEMWMPWVRKGAKVAKVTEEGYYRAFGKMVKLGKEVSETCVLRSRRLRKC